MSRKIEFEIQVEDPKSRHGWTAIGGREGKLYFGEDDYEKTRALNTAALRKVIDKIRANWQENWIKPRDLRIVKISTVVTYEVVE